MTVTPDASASAPVGASQPSDTSMPGSQMMPLNPYLAPALKFK